MNKFIGIGNVTNNIDLKNTNNGKSVCNFALAIRRDENTTDFINCVAYGKTSEVLSKYATKGTKIAVEGRLQVRNYKDKENKTIYVTEVIVFEITLLSSKREEKQENVTLEVDQSRIVTENIDKAFEDFGNTIELTDDDIAF